MPTGVTVNKQPNIKVKKLARKKAKEVIKKIGKKKNIRPGRKDGRPLAKIDKKQFEKLCKLQCTMAEVAAYFDVTSMTLETWCKRTYGCTFFILFTAKRDLGKISLRRSQWQMSEHSVAMSIWLGKQYLDQKEPERNLVILDIPSKEYRDERNKSLEDNL